MLVGYKRMEMEDGRYIQLVDSKTGKGLRIHFDLENQIWNWVHTKDLSEREKRTGAQRNLLLNGFYITEVDQLEFFKLHKRIRLGGPIFIPIENFNPDQYPSLKEIVEREEDIRKWESLEAYAKKRRNRTSQL